ncbi:hypothetical protein AJ80_09476 [Polytolypa hystricis UAMH7299]|uniref:RING-type E3 ubiquitin transferase n=1 Tax=Polytolypa hystricis (strain UAMH7299) TaxID=1447883 RepID=A0A2B7WQ91_POLH7|nr:hypothetical protein AJ80_09476 [Polytolypa hystricis UAMH7299]
MSSPSSGSPSSSLSFRTPPRSRSDSQDGILSRESARLSSSLTGSTSASAGRGSYTGRDGLARRSTVGPGGSASSRPRRSDSDSHTLLDFLRSDQNMPENAEGASDTGVSADRKRRFTGTSDEAGQQRSVSGPSFDLTSTDRPRHAVRRSSWRASPAGVPGSSRDNAIDLSGSQESVSRQLNSLRHRERSFTDHTLPRWQPDSEVSQCPICGTAFSFWYRKHHCRKCGRVVCASCSPHRITIPRQFIVRPPEPTRSLASLIQPNPSQTSFINLIDNEDPNASSSNTGPLNLPSGGGEEVRLCNPCVPDPNPEPPRRYTTMFSGSEQPSGSFSSWSSDLGGRPHAASSRDSALADYPQASSSGNLNLPFHRPSASLPSSTVSRSEAARELRRQRGRGMIFQPETPEIERAAQERPPDEGLPSYGSFDYTVVPNFRGLPPRYQASQSRNQSSQHSPPAYTSGTAAVASASRHRSSYPSARSASSHEHYSSLLASRNRPLPTPPTSGHRRAHVDERDICPVCSQVLPSQGADGSESARESHIRTCIEGHSGNTASSDNQSSQPPNGPVRMLSFTATEKDCMGEDGVTQECTICMEEYEVGAQLARLECLCKFHKPCIVEWFGRKQECPVHKVY